ncbi:hypothetical protein [Thalassoglobus sp.]|uniref:hypothetical protein n=1 Tax=Thalassoglobus sp. TaxID=2795869 RepID=UPI003AA824BC
MNSLTTSTHEVPADRLELGTWCHTQDRQPNEGDIAGSYSGDVIAMENRIRKPFEFRKALHVTVSISGSEKITAEAYRLLQPRFFEGTPTTYHERTRSTIARENPNGFYHGMCVPTVKKITSSLVHRSNFVHHKNPSLCKDRCSDRLISKRE